MGNDVEKLRRPFPACAIKQRDGGGRLLSYVEGHTVVHRLNEACSEWNMRIVEHWREGDVMVVVVELEIPGLGTRQHIGVQRITERGGEDLFKGAVTDALKKAATLFGVGLELYGPDYEEEQDATASWPACRVCGMAFTEAQAAYAERHYRGMCKRCYHGGRDGRA